MAFNTLHHSTILFIIISSVCFPKSHDEPIEITTTIYHRDSPSHSPLYDGNQSPLERVRREVARARSRLHSTSTPTANVTANSFGTSYLMNISLGTPPVTIVAYVDTGSDLIWTPCTPCKACFNQTLPLFQPTQSSTYTEFTCNSSISACPPTTSTELSCTKLGNVCEYAVLYGDYSFSHGTLARETIIMDSSSNGHRVKLHKIIFGCGSENGGSFYGASGIVGLGGGSESMVSQLGSRIDGKFSYCLTEDVDSVSRITFGSKALAKGEGVVKTRLFSSKGRTFYTLALKRFTVGPVEIPYSLTSSDPANILIDSGTTLTYLPRDTYSKFESALVNQIRGADRVSDPSGSGLSCYKGNFTSPNVTVHFLDDAVVNLRKFNLFLKMTPNEDLFCLAFASSDDFIPIYGNVAQKNFVIAFDIPANAISFKPSDCNN